MTSIGYVRVSTADQDSTLQRDALRKAGCDKVFEDCASGARTDRPGLAEALRYAREGDTLTVWKLDRLGRSMKCRFRSKPAGHSDLKPAVIPN